MKISGFFALLSFIGTATVPALVVGHHDAATGVEPATLTTLGYESIFDGWEENALPKVVVHGRGVMPEVDPGAQRMYEGIAKDLKQPPDEFVEASWSGYEFLELNDEIRASYPDIYVTASRANPGLTSSRYDLVFTKMPPAELVERVRSLPVDVDIRYDAPLS